VPRGASGSRIPGVAVTRVTSERVAGILRSRRRGPGIALSGFSLLLGLGLDLGQDGAGVDASSFKVTFEGK